MNIKLVSLYLEEDMPFSIEMNQDAELSFLYFPGNLSEVNDKCEEVCSTHSIYDFCRRNRFEIRKVYFCFALK